MREIQYDVDIMKQNYNYKACMQNDDLFLKINFFKDGKKYNLSDSVATLNWLSPNNTPLSATMEIEDNIASVKLDKDFTNIVGKAEFEIEVEKEGQMTTFNLELQIIKKVFNSDKVNIAVLKLIETIKIDEAISSFLDNIKEKVNEITEKLKTKVDLKQVKTYPILEEEIKIKDTINSNIAIDEKYEYGNVLRYGADPTCTECSSNSFQIAVDVVEKLFVLKKGVYPVRVPSGNYKITKTIILKANEWLNKYAPLSFIGDEGKKVDSGYNSGSVLIPKIKNYTEKDYANLFAINIKYENGIDTDVTYYGGGINAPICSNIAFKNLTFHLSDSDMEEYNYTINVIKAYRCRFTIENIYCNNMNSFMLQPEKDGSGGSSYCDFSQYKNINLSNMKTSGLELYNADNSIVSDVTCHRPQPTFNGLVILRGGGGITINRIHFSYSFIKNTLTPLNLGSGASGSKAYIKLSGVRGCSIDGVYGERQLLDYVFYIYSSRNISISNVCHSFFGNGFLRSLGGSSNISVSNVHMNSNITAEYNDFHFDTEDDLNDLKVKNFFRRKWYNEEISYTQTDYSNLTRDTNNTKEQVKCFRMNFSTGNKFELEKMTLRISYVATDKKWLVKDMKGNEVTDYFNVAWATKGERQGLEITPVNAKIGYALRTVSPCTLSGVNITLPIIYTSSTYFMILFYDFKQNAFLSEPINGLTFLVDTEVLM